MPAASERGAALPATLELVGEVCAGVGEAAGFTALDWVREAFLERLGFLPHPGTFNLAMHDAAWDEARQVLARAAGIAIEPPAGYCAARCFPVTVNDAAEGALVRPEVPGYPADKFEIVAPVALRRLLGVADGDRVRVRLRLGSGAGGR